LYRRIFFQPHAFELIAKRAHGLLQTPFVAFQFHHEIGSHLCGISIIANVGSRRSLQQILK